MNQTELQKKIRKLPISIRLEDGSIGCIFIDYGQILYLESDSNCTLIYVEKEFKEKDFVKSSEGKNFVKSSKTLKSYDEQLCQDGSFFRIHDSYIVNLQKLCSFKKGTEKSFVTLTDKTELKVSRGKKGELSQIRTSKFPVIRWDEVFYVDINSILYLEAQGDRTEFHITGSSSIVSSKNIGFFEPVLAGSLFVRIHDKYIINLTKVTKYYKGNTAVSSTGKGLPVSTGYAVLNTGKGLPVSRKEDFLSFFNNKPFNHSKLLLNA